MIYFITESYIKSQTLITKNVDAQMVMPCVQAAADLHISLLLGQEYYQYLLDKYNQQTLTAAEIVLVEHLQPATAWTAAEIAVGMNAAAFTNKGMQTQSGEYSASADLNTLSYVRNEYKNMAEYYRNRVVRFLKLNEADYPGYTADSNRTDTPPSKGDEWDNLGMMIV
jgi:hypothetical protein